MILLYKLSKNKINISHDLKNHKLTKKKTL